MTIDEAVVALDAGKLQWRYSYGRKSEWRPIRRDDVQHRYRAGNEARISVVIDSPSWLSFATGGMSDGLDAGELAAHPTRYRVIP